MKHILSLTIYFSNETKTYTINYKDKNDLLKKVDTRIKNQGHQVIDFKASAFILDDELYIVRKLSGYL